MSWLLEVRGVELKAGNEGPGLADGLKTATEDLEAQTSFSKTPTRKP